VPWRGGLLAGTGRGTSHLWREPAPVPLASLISSDEEEEEEDQVVGDGHRLRWHADDDGSEGREGLGGALAALYDADACADS